MYSRIYFCNSQNGGRRARANALNKYWGDHQRFFRNVISAFKLPTVIAETEKALSEGKSVVISLVGTGEARTREQVARAKAANGNLEDLDFSPREVIANMVDRGFPTTLYRDVTDPISGKTVQEPVRLKLLLQYVKQQTGREPSSLHITDLDVPMILSFLDYLEQHRNNKVRSRNARLAAIRTFFRWIALREPESLGLATRVLAIPLKRTDKKLVQALSRHEIDAILAAPDLTQWQGRRNHALLLTLYNSGARVSEISSLQRGQVHFGVTTFLQLHGKGRKERTVPLWTKTSRALQSWFRELERESHQTAFPSVRGKPLSRDGVDHILQQAVGRAAGRCPSLQGRKVSPHSVRHSTAMHLLQSGVDISVIALWLGHESIETTHIYLEADLETKERALAKLAPAGSKTPRFKATDDILAFLAKL